MSFKVPEEFRLTTGPLASSYRRGRNGAFIIPSKLAGRTLVIIASDGTDWAEGKLPGQPWEHVSVHIEQGSKQRIPTWEEMCQVKDIFWDDEDTVIQFHPAKSEYVNMHSYTLHLWHPTFCELPVPPSITVGFKNFQIIDDSQQP